MDTKEIKVYVEKNLKKGKFDYRMEYNGFLYGGFNGKEDAISFLQKMETGKEVKRK